MPRIAGQASSRCRQAYGALIALAGFVDSVFVSALDGGAEYDASVDGSAEIYRSPQCLVGYASGLRFFHSTTGAKFASAG